MLAVYLLFFLFTEEILKIIFGLTFLSLILVNDFLGSKKKKNKGESASKETLYDAMKFIVFGIFSIIYPHLKNVPFIIFIFAFVVVLYGINYLKSKSS